MNTRADLRILFTFCFCVLLLIGAACFLMHARWTPGGLVNKTIAGEITVAWTVVCDNQGHYTFTDDKGTLWGIREWDTYQDAWDYAMDIKCMRESVDPLAVEAEHHRLAEIKARKWEACPP